MKRAQAVTFWKELADSTEVKLVVGKYQRKSGYGGERTLERYAAAAEAFQRGLSAEYVVSKTGWSLDYVAKIRPWWEEALGSARRSSPATGTGRPAAPAEGPIRHQATQSALAGHWTDLQQAGRILRSGVFEERDSWGWPSPIGVSIPQLLAIPPAPGRQSYDDTVSIKTQRGEYEVTLAAEGNLLIKCVRQHVPEQPLWRLLHDWKSKVGSIAKGLTTLVALLEESPELGGWRLLTDREFGEGVHGISSMFCRIAVARALQDALLGKAEPGYSVPQVKPTEHRVYLEAGMAYGLGIGGTPEEAEKIKRLFGAVLNRAAQAEDLGTVARQIQKMGQLEGKIREQLHAIELRPAFPGQCDLCSDLAAAR